uniref:KIB1-4 beta-propeller domain-containing protein n=1 Tax=Oryza nivara TaxID=4536 RepID=A0A0E0HHD4_ORYNI
MDGHQLGPWNLLPDDILELLVGRNLCEIDRLHARRVCHSWRAAFARIEPPPPPPPLPLLLLPEADDDEHGLAFSCVLSGWDTHPFFLPRAARRRARCFGSCDGVWLFLAMEDGLQGDRARDHVLVNLHSFQFLDLPNVIRLDHTFPQLMKDIEIAIVAVTLSRQPTQQGCVAAGIIELPPFPIGVRPFAFWRMGDRVILPFYEDVFGDQAVEDVIYHNGYFLFLTQDEHIRVCQEPVFHDTNVDVDSILLRFEPRVDDGDAVLARYLVLCRGKVLMVVRLGCPHRRSPTSAFRVFERVDYLVVNAGVVEVLEHTWSEIDELGGRMLFLGRGCSRSYEEADGYPGMEGVYFLDDRSFRDPIFHDPDMVFDHTYHCCDNGRWSKSPFNVDRCFPERGRSKISPPKLTNRDEVLRELYRRIPCEIDRHYARRVCHSWRAALARLQPPAPHPQVPWLLLPETNEHGLTFSCVLSECRAHRFFLPSGARRARYFGSYDGAWLFLAVDGRGAQAQDHLLVNLNNFQYLDLPNAILLHNWYEPDKLDLKKVAIVAAALSRPPTERGCVVAGIIEPFLSAHRVAFWRMGDRVISPQPAWPLPLEEVEDILHYTFNRNGREHEAFLVLTTEENVLVCEPRFHGSSVQVLSNLVRFIPRGSDGQPVLARYLVESRGEVLMVVRLGSAIQYDPSAEEFRVFERRDFNDGKFNCIWNSMSELEGRMLFVGRGCSRSYEAADGPAMEGVYFLDDRSFRDPIFHDPYEQPIFRRANRCSDNGKWLEAPFIRLDRCLPERGPSKCSPPRIET